MNAKPIFFGITCLLVLGVVAWIGHGQKAGPPAKPKLTTSIKPQHLADALRAVVAANREVYTLATTGAAEGKSLPNPCEMLRRGSEATASKGVEFSYVLRSLQPVSPRNAPVTDVEKKGLEFVASQPASSYSSEELLGGRWYFTAVYADVAFTQSCVECHNRLPGNARKDYRLGDVMGGLVIRVALEL